MGRHRTQLDPILQPSPIASRTRETAASSLLASNTA
jgi:hypothetical protein